MKSHDPSKRRILLVCTGNSCRSQMAEGLLKSIGTDIEVYSAGIEPEKNVSPFAIQVLREAGIDISNNLPKSIHEFKSQSWDFVITLSKRANLEFPAFFGPIGTRIHIEFDDPYEARGTYEEKLQVYRRIRDEIEEAFQSFYLAYIHPSRSGGCGCGCGCSN